MDLLAVVISNVLHMEKISDCLDYRDFLKIKFDLLKKNKKFFVSKGGRLFRYKPKLLETDN